MGFEIRQWHVIHRRVQNAVIIAPEIRTLGNITVAQPKEIGFVFKPNPVSQVVIG
jgi:hypothetical protein